MKYDYPNLSPDQFELVVTLICKKILGMGVQKFTKGRDGGRDGKFVGRANSHPSLARPWDGSVIIQSKHTSAFNASFSDLSFFSGKSQNTVVGNEIPSILKMRQSGELDYYMLFANRKLSADASVRISSKISTICNIPLESITLYGIDDLEIFLKQFPEIVAMAEVDMIDSPLIISSDDMAEIVEALSPNFQPGKITLNPPTPRVSYEDKNELNNMTSEYARTLKKRSLKDTKQIQDFLSAPENATLLDRYNEAIEEFDLNIIAKRKDYQTFDEVINQIASLLFGRERILARNKRLTWAILFYMYWICDIGKVSDDSTE